MPSRLSDDTKKMIAAAWMAPGATARTVALTCGVGETSARDHRPRVTGRATGPARSPSLPDPAPEAGGPGLPDPHETARPLAPHHLDESGTWLVLGDTHIPMHDRATIEAAVSDARHRNTVGVLLNGDILDMFGISPFFRLPTKDRFVDEIEAGRQFLGWLRSKFPNGRICYREGNHEFRFTRYVVDRAPALFDLPGCTLPELLGLADLGVEWVAGKRKVMVGKLPTLHGHEFRQTIGNVASPARLAFLRATGTVLVSHHHRTSSHSVRTLDDKNLKAWSVGCACYMSPDYDPYNQWNHGYAMVEVASDGWYSVQNREVINGRVV